MFRVAVAYSERAELRCLPSIRDVGAIAGARLSIQILEGFLSSTPDSVPPGASPVGRL